MHPVRKAEPGRGPAASPLSAFAPSALWRPSSEGGAGGRVLAPLVSRVCCLLGLLGPRTRAAHARANHRVTTEAGARTRAAHARANHRVTTEAAVWALVRALGGGRGRGRGRAQGLEAVLPRRRGLAIARRASAVCARGERSASERERTSAAAREGTRTRATERLGERASASGARPSVSRCGVRERGLRGWAPRQSGQSRLSGARRRLGRRGRQERSEGRLRDALRLSDESISVAARASVEGHVQ